ncbi:hypothetical protein TeGR_g1534 [Tetraparma gracilis]|uniref:Uncharacterized protein n=1 Tax=Tetraparma gracilis TaxID=2962635 RepID=A0ABQ6NEY7_9STRA|nr:hypothetical protein TeGR_g1534 [Tetraparma gracilis]
MLRRSNTGPAYYYSRMMQYNPGDIRSQLTCVCGYVNFPEDQSCDWQAVVREMLVCVECGKGHCSECCQWHEGCRDKIDAKFGLERMGRMYRFELEIVTREREEMEEAREIDKEQEKEQKSGGKVGAVFDEWVGTMGERVVRLEKATVAMEKRAEPMGGRVARLEKATVAMEKRAEERLASEESEKIEKSVIDEERMKKMGEMVNEWVGAIDDRMEALEDKMDEQVRAMEKKFEERTTAYLMELGARLTDRDR